MFRELEGALLVGQAGGPSPVINASVLGAVHAGFGADCITNVYGARNGIAGVLDDRLLLMDDIDRTELDKLMYTPASALGSCRVKLPDYSVDDAPYRRILEIFKKYGIRYFCYNGGNDSMDTCSKISRFMKESGYECRVFGIPKTIDNDLCITDHCPGYGSTAKYIATSVIELDRDTAIYNTGAVTVVECMGRHAGWLTASAALANIDRVCCDLIYLPERDFDMDSFLSDIRECFERKNGCMVAISEGVHYADGTFVSDTGASSTDGFGHVQLGGLSYYLKGVVKEKLGYKTRNIELSLLQRCAGHCASRTDAEEAYMAGHMAVGYMLDGVSDKMTGFECDRSGGDYTCAVKLVDLMDVAGTEKKFPDKWINEAGNNVTADFIRYALPLIQGEPDIKRKNGLPDYIIL